MCMTCSGGGGKSSTPRSATSQPYRPTSKPMVNRQSAISTPRGASNMTRANTFGTPTVRFSGRK